MPGRYQKNLYIDTDRGNDSDSGSGETSAATGDNDGSASSKSQTSLNSSKDANKDPNLSTSLEEDDDDVSLPMTEDASHNLHWGETTVDITNQRSRNSDDAPHVIKCCSREVVVFLIVQNQQPLIKVFENNLLPQV